MNEKLYLPSQHDLVYGLLNARVLRSGGDSQTSGDFAIADFYVVPAQYAFLLENVCVELTGGGAQVAQSWTLRVAAGGTTYQIAAGTNFDQGAQADLYESKMLNVLLLEGDSIDCRARFDAGVATNVLNVYIQGVLFPRANIQAI